MKKLKRAVVCSATVTFVGALINIITCSVFHREPLFALSFADGEYIGFGIDALKVSSGGFFVGFHPVSLVITLLLIFITVVIVLLGEDYFK